MPFGIKDPSSYTRDDREVIYADSYDSCPICNVELPFRADSKSVAPILIPQKPLDEHPNVVAFGCSSCYQAQRKMDFVFLKDLENYRKSKTAARTLKSESVEGKISRPVGRPRKSEVIVKTEKRPVGRPKKTDELGTSFVSGRRFTPSDVRSLLKAAKLIEWFFQDEAKQMAQELSEQKSIHNSIAHSELGAMDDLDLPPEVEAGFKEAEEHRQLLIDNNIVSDESTSHMSSTELCIYHGLIEDKALKEFMASCVAPVDLDPDEVAKDW